MGSKTYAAGLVVYRLAHEGIIEYLLLKASYPPYHWTPPKGHVDPGETDHLVTALRETEEEAGLAKSDLQVDDFKLTITYQVKGRPKDVSYWPAKLITSKEVKLSDEHTDLAWVPCEEAVKMIGFSTTGDIIRKFQQHLEAKR